MSAADVIRHHVQLLVNLADANGLVLTVEQRPLQPLAMGHYTTEVSVRPARVRAEPRPPFDLDDACRAAMERLTAGIDEAVYEAREDQAVEGALARMAMEERHHGPRGVPGNGVTFNVPPGAYMVSIGCVGGGGGSAGMGGRL